MNWKRPFKRISGFLGIVTAVLLWHALWWLLLAPWETRDRLAQTDLPPHGAPHLSFLPIPEGSGQLLPALWSPMLSVPGNATADGNSREMVAAAPALDFAIDLAETRNRPLSREQSFFESVDPAERLARETETHLRLGFTAPRVLHEEGTTSTSIFFDPLLEERRPETLPKLPPDLPSETWFVEFQVIIDEEGEVLSALETSTSEGSGNIALSLARWVRSILFTPLPREAGRLDTSGRVRIARGRS